MASVGGSYPQGRRFESFPRTHYGPLVQLVRTLACHARGRGFESHPGRQSCFCKDGFASVAQLVEQRIENPRVVGSIPTGGTNTGNQLAVLNMRI